MSLRTTTRRVKVSFLLGAGALAGAATLAFVLASSSGAVPRPQWTTVQQGLSAICETGTTFNLTTRTGHIQTPDGGSVFMWGFTMDVGNVGQGGTGNGKFQMPGPVLCVNEGDPITINLENPAAPLGPGEPVSIVFRGQSGVLTSGGDVDGLFTREVTPGGATVTYTFTADEPGTYLYESGTNPHKQIEMGLYGALIVRPTGPGFGPNFAYNDASTEFDPAREYLLLMHEIDPALHLAVERIQPFDATTKHDRYWTINGRSFPDTVTNHFAPWLPAQPYGAFVWIRADSPQPALIRYANAGLRNHPFHPHANHVQVIARDGRPLGDLSMEAFTKTIGAGQTTDGLFRWNDVEHWTPDATVPVQIPGLLNLVFKDDYTSYSGSPYLGFQDDLPPAVATYNQCGEFYYPWHSHALNEFQNFNEGFGGLATLLRVDPPLPKCPASG